MIIVHDTAASKVPFEMLLAAPNLRPAVESGITRRLSVRDLAVERQFARPPKKGKLNVLLVANPTQDLPGAAKEAQAVQDILKSQSAYLELEEYWEKDATVENVRSALRRADILHYCGHAFFDEPVAAGSGLILAGHVEFTGEDLAKVEPLPRMAFVNACEAGRVRGAPPTHAVAFAELFLQSGMDAYLGTYWEVGDTAAALFAGIVYTRLAIGDTLEQATLAGRRALFDKNQPDWSNYLLYGGGNFRLVAQK
jgi:CHAT domain-containing protein